MKNHNYSAKGAYFVTICIKDRQRILSEIVGQGVVGDGALDVPSLRLTPIGKIVEKHLLSSENISGVKIDRYVIMPDHIHTIIFLDPDEYVSRRGGTSKDLLRKSAPSPTNEMLPHVVSTFKRFCNKEIGFNVFQRAYIEHVIRDRDEYQAIRNYISKNPARRYYRNLNKDK